jgi:hypothetical protein
MHRPAVREAKLARALARPGLEGAHRTAPLRQVRMRLLELDAVDEQIDLFVIEGDQPGNR